MHVSLLSYTQDALDLLLFTKSTRLRMSPHGLAEVKNWPTSKKIQELRYMLGTIQSSWEFVEYTFAIEKVTRAFTHQLVRHRVGTSFAQQSQRTVDMSGFTYHRDNDITGVGRNLYDSAMQNTDTMYSELVKIGVRPEGARGILPTNIHTNIIFKANLRALHEMMLKRLCVKAQGEFQDVAKLLRACVLDVHPWADSFLRVGCAASGVCIFENVKWEDCPIKPHIFNPDTGAAHDGGPKIHTRTEIQQQWQETLGALPESDDD